MALDRSGRSEKTKEIKQKEMNLETEEGREEALGKINNELLIKLKKAGVELESNAFVKTHRDAVYLYLSNGYGSISFFLYDDSIEIHFANDSVWLDDIESHSRLLTVASILKNHEKVSKIIKRQFKKYNSLVEEIFKINKL